MFYVEQDLIDSFMCSSVSFGIWLVHLCSPAFYVEDMIDSFIYPVFYLEQDLINSFMYSCVLYMEEDLVDSFMYSVFYMGQDLIDSFMYSCFM